MDINWQMNLEKSNKTNWWSGKALIASHRCHLLNPMKQTNQVLEQWTNIINHSENRWLTKDGVLLKGVVNCPSDFSLLWRFLPSWIKTHLKGKCLKIHTVTDDSRLSFHLFTIQPFTTRNKYNLKSFVSTTLDLI